MTVRILARLVMLAVLLPLCLSALAEDAPPLPQRNPARLQEPAEQAPVLPAEAPSVAWTGSEVAVATAKCTEMLKDVALDYQLLAPLKDGLCGTPAPILVKSVGAEPKVAIDPPATLTCPLARALHAWLGKIVQPEAKVTLGSDVVALHNASSYVCRNRNGSGDGLISQHAFANALDISEFVLASGERVTVLETWPTVPAEPPPPRPNPERIIETKSAPLPQPPPVATPPMAPKASAQTGFVRRIHEAACRSFSTVLGPDANEAHKDHFHVDMKARRHSNFCE